MLTGRKAMRRDRTVPLLRFALACLTVACFAPVRTCDFVDIDDPRYVTENPHVREGLTASSLAWAWTDCSWSMYAPLTRTSFLIDAQLHGLNPAGYHFTNVLLHLMNVLLLFELLRSMTGAVWRSALTAACFAIHPLHVESVAWITERKDVLSTLFGLLALLGYVRYTRAPSRRGMMLVLGAYALSLLAKPMLVTLPFVLLLLDHWPLARTQSLSWRRLIWEKAPLLVFALAACAVTACVHGEMGATKALGDLPLRHRLANAAVSCIDYLIQTVWPAQLAVYYPHPLNHLPIWKTAASVLVLGATSLVVIGERKRRPSLFIGWLWFLGTLIPVLGVVAMGGYARADRYTYVPHIGLFLGLIWCLDPCWLPAKLGRLMVGISAGGVLAVWGVLTWKQVLTWKNSVTLWEQALHVTRDNFVAHGSLAQILHLQQRDEEAIQHYETALRINPDHKQSLLGLGSIRLMQGQCSEAHRLLSRAAVIAPDEAPSHLLHGIVLEKLGRLAEADASLRMAMRLDPSSVEAHLNLGVILERLDQLNEAEQQFQEARRLDPSSASAHYNLGIVRERTGRWAEASDCFHEALEHEPHHPATHAHLGVQCEQEGDLDEAASHLLIALSGRPKDAETHCNLGVVRERQSRLADAEVHLRKAAMLAPSLPQVHANLGIVLQRQGKHEEAIDCFHQAIALAPDWVDAHCDLGAVLFERGDSESATKEFAKAARLDPLWQERARQKAWVLAVHPEARVRNGPEALRLARQVWYSSAEDAPTLDVLAVALAENGDCVAACRTAERAKTLAIQAGAVDQVSQIDSRLKLYRQARPYHEPPLPIAVGPSH
jgi:Flp pilus assembly protein TadD